MLLQFTVENFLSIKEQAVLSMLEPAHQTAGPRHVQQLEGGWRVMRCAALYGANAAGKSNVVKALEAVSRLARVGTPQLGAPLGLVPFRLDAEWRGKPTRFELELVLDGARYSYGLEATNNAVVSEWLYRAVGDTEELLFERNAPDDGAAEHAFKFGDGVFADEERRQFARFVGKGTRPNQPFLAECPQRNVGEFSVVTSWLRDGLLVVYPDANFWPLAAMLEGERARAFVEQRLRAWGTGIASIGFRKLPAPASNDQPEVAALTQHLNTAGSMAQLGATGEPFIATVEEGQILFRRLQFAHTATAGTENFSWQEESSGTQRLMHLMPLLCRLDEEAPGQQVCIVDELERSLHPALTRRFVEDFLELSERHGEHGAQLLFTTHDTNLLSGGLLPAASIWFAEKDSVGATHLYSLAEYQPEQLGMLTEHLEDGYLQGRFGAIPFNAARSQLQWRATGTEP